MSTSSQTRALRSYRRRLKRRGIARFEVLAPTRDRDLIRDVARGLSGQEQDAQRIRAALQRALVGAIGSPGRILAALRRSPLVGAHLDLERSVADDRRVEL